jgi:hypothetical protein
LNAGRTSFVLLADLLAVSGQLFACGQDGGPKRWYRHASLPSFRNSREIRRVSAKNT